MTRQWGQVQLEQSDMRLALNSAKLATGGFLHAAEEKMQHVIRKPWAHVRKQKKWGVESPGHNNVKSAMVKHPAMLRENLPEGYLPGQNATALNQQTCWRHKLTGAPPPDQLRQPTPQPTPRPPRMPSLPPSNNEDARLSKIEGMPPRHLCGHSALPCTRCFTYDKYTEDCKRN